MAQKEAYEKAVRETLAPKIADLGLRALLAVLVRVLIRKAVVCPEELKKDLDKMLGPYEQENLIEMFNDLPLSLRQESEKVIHDMLEEERGIIRSFLDEAKIT